jgi:hypothetical protein
LGKRARLQIRTSKFAGFFARIRVFADLAQLVEQFIRNEKVASSIPAIGTRHSLQAQNPLLSQGCGFFVVCSGKNVV